MRAYIEAHDEEEDNFSIIVEVNGVLAGKAECPPKPWLYLDYNDDGDLIINNSPSMEDNRWDHITKEILTVEEVID